MNGITIVGSYNVGLFLKGSKLPDIGETAIADEFLETGGGKGSNQAVAASMLGAPVRLIARIGSDAYGRDALAMYDRLGIAADGIIVDETIHSGVSVILIDATGNNLISVVPGANLRLSNQDLDRFDEVFHNSAIVGFQLENDRELVRYCLRVGPQSCAPISENRSASPGLYRKFPSDSDLRVSLQVASATPDVDQPFGYGLSWNLRKRDRRIYPLRMGELTSTIARIHTATSHSVSLDSCELINPIGAR